MDKQQAWQALLAAIAGQRFPRTAPEALVDLMGAADGGLFLAQLVVWSERSSGPWVTRSYAEWEETTGLSAYSVRHYTMRCEARGLLKARVKQEGNSVRHRYQLQREVLLQQLLARAGEPLRATIPAPEAITAQWQVTLAELRPQMEGVTFTRVLQGSRALCLQDDHLVVGVRSTSAAAWFNARLRVAAERTLNLLRQVERPGAAPLQVRALAFSAIPASPLPAAGRAQVPETAAPPRQERSLATAPRLRVPASPV